MHKVRLVIKTHVMTAHYDLGDAEGVPEHDNLEGLPTGFTAYGFIKYLEDYEDTFVYILSLPLYKGILEGVERNIDTVEVYIESYEGEL